jgi:hypothetical protein
MDLSGNDLDNVTRTILAEAGQNATPASMAAVASVIRNRLAAGGYGNTPSAIVHAPNQFEPWNPNSGNDPSRFDQNSPAYKQAAALAQGVFSGVVNDPTAGATHFFAPAAQAALGRSRPTWAGSPPTAEIGGHQFFAPSGPVTADAIGAVSATPGYAPGGPETATPYSGPGSQPTPQNAPPITVPPTGQTQLAALLAGMKGSQPQGGGGGGGLLGNLLFGRQGIMGLLPQQIQQSGLVGSAINGLGSVLRGGAGGNAPIPPAPQQTAQAPAAAQAPGIIPGQRDPHQPGFDAGSVPYLGKTADAGQPPPIAGLLAQLFGSQQASAA